MSVRHAVGLPNVGVFGSVPALVELAVLAEHSGWDGVHLWDPSSSTTRNGRLRAR